MTTRHKLGWSGAVAVALVVAAGLTGCTPASSSPTATPSARASAPPQVVTNVRTAPGTAKGFVGALKDVTVKSCVASSSPSKFGGTVTNPTGVTQSYRIYVSLLTGSTTLGIDQVNVPDVAANAAASWSGTLRVGGAGVRCVLRVERTAAK